MTHRSLRGHSIRKNGLLICSLAAATLWGGVPFAGQIAQAQTGYYGIPGLGNGTTIRGTVTRSNNVSSTGYGVFELRAENGETLRVILHQDIRFLADYRNFDNNTRVEIEGVRDGDILIAQDLRFYDNGRYYSVLRGTVQSDVRIGRFTLNTGSNRNVTVNTRNALRANVQQGDEVEVRGTWQNKGRFAQRGIFTAESVSFVDGSGGNYPGGNDYETGRYTTIRGWVAQRSSDNDFQLSLSGGRTVRVVAQNSIRVTRNDYLEVRGRWDRSGQVFRADNVQISNSGNVDRTGNRVDFAATVTSINTRTNVVSVRGDNGRTYTVNSTDSDSDRVDEGDRVRVIGHVDQNGAIQADRVMLERDYNPNDPYYGDTTSNTTLDFTGTIISTPTLLLRDYYTVRTNGGREFRVRFNSNEFREGDRVRVRGRVGSNSIIDADSMVRI